MIKLIVQEMRDLAGTGPSSGSAALVTVETLRNWAAVVSTLREVVLAEAKTAAQAAANGHVDLAAPYEAEIARGHAMKCVHAIEQLAQTPKP